jgi:hypothetical protein
MESGTLFWKLQSTSDARSPGELIDESVVKTLMSGSLAAHASPSTKPLCMRLKRVLEPTGADDPEPVVIVPPGTSERVVEPGERSDSRQQRPRTETGLSTLNT